MEDTTESQIIPLAEGFDEAGRQDWTALVEKALNGRPIDKVLNTRTYEGVTLDPLYRSGQGNTDSGHRSASRGPASLARNSGGWDIRQPHLNPDPAAANVDIKADLAGGTSSVWIGLDSGARQGADDFAADGLVARRAVDLETALAGVDLAQTSIALKPGGAFIASAAALVSIALRRGVDSASLNGSFGADPLGALAEAGRLGGPIDLHLEALGGLAAWSATNTPGIRAVWVDTGMYHGAGATETQELAFAIGTAIRYLHAMTKAGMSADAACGQIGFTLSVGTDVFQTIAKLRAARRLWARVAEACGAGAEAQVMALGAATAIRSMSRRDTWVNLLRATCSCFAAGVGGADSITVRPHTDAVGLAEPLARRVARNIQTILVQESSLARVADPAGGSYYVEQLCDQYARRGWGMFQEIEAGGGMTQALLSGRVAEMVGASWVERERNLARRRDELTGVSSFPDLEEVPSPVAEPDIAVLSAIVDGARAGDDIKVPRGMDFDGLIEAAGKGASFTALSKCLTGDAVEGKALVQHRLGEAFEVLRDASDAMMTGGAARPMAFVAQLGTPADYTARAVFSKSYLASAGIGAVETEVKADGAGTAFGESGAALAVICSSDSIYASDAVDCAKSLKAAGARVVVLAGRPGENEADRREAGVDRFIHAGDDMLETLREVAREIGMLKP
jgi:methylmalonyl-CoA mutase